MSDGEIGRDRLTVGHADAKDEDVKRSIHPEMLARESMAGKTELAVFKPEA